MDSQPTSGPPSARASFNGDPRLEEVKDLPDRDTESNANHDMRRYAGRDMDREATRYLSAATQLYIDYAQRVVQKIVGESYRALAPAYGVDVGLVTRWALDSLRRRMQRDILLTIVFVCGLLLSSLLLFQPLFSVAIIAVMFLSAWIIVSQEYWIRMYRNVVGKMLRSRFDPDPTSGPEPRDQRLCERLDAAMERRSGNLVVFSGQSAFVGSGQRLSKEQVVIDVSRGKEIKDGEPSQPLPFTNLDINSALVSAFKEIDFDDMHIEQRLFVNGRHIGEDDALVRKQSETSLQSEGHSKQPQPPPALVDPELIRRAALHPTPDARVYVCVEMPGWQGQLVVTLFARAVHKGGLLYIEWRFYVLPPLRKEFLAVDRLYERSRTWQLRHASVWGLRHMVSALLGSPFRVAIATWRALALKKHTADQSNAIRNGRVFDYGARRSIREDACGESRLHYFLARDEVMYVLFAQEALLRAIENFLDEHNVDLAGFKSQVKVIIEATYENYNVHLGNVSDSSIAIGNSAQAGTGGKGGKATGTRS